MSKKKARPPIEHGFIVRLKTHGGRPAGRRWFGTVRPRKRSPSLVHFLDNIKNDPYLTVASITPATQPKRGG